MDFQQSHGYMRPPPPPPPPPATSDPYYHHQAPQRPPPPNTWYPNQYPHQLPPPPHQQQPPPPHHQWPPQHSDQYLPPHHSYPSHPPPPSYLAPPNQYPHPPPHSHTSLPPRPHMPPHASHSYPPVSQEWGHASWGHQQSWDYQANNNEEAWAAKARAWAASKVASDDQQSQHTAQEFNNGSNAADFTSAYAGHDTSISSAVHQQEVPSTYTTVAGDPMQGMEHAAAPPPDYSFVPPAEPAVNYPPVQAMFPTGSQVDYAVTAPPSVPGHPTPIYGRMPGPSFQPTVSLFGMGLGPELHPGTTFSGDSFGVPVAAERPKKASVPNWLREEIIKNKPVIFNSTAEITKDYVNSTEDDSGKVDQKSFDSWSTEKEEDDEEDLEAAKTAAINHEIKRIVTDVLLQVTAELFDEIATKVLSEEDPTVEGGEMVASTANVPDTKAVSLPLKIKDTVSSDVGVKFDSSPGDLLGLASYASDDDDDDDDDDDSKASLKPAFKENNSQQSTVNNSSTGKDVVDNGGLEEKERNVRIKLESDLPSSGKVAPKLNCTATTAELKEDGAENTSNAEPRVAEQRFSHDTSKTSNIPSSKGAEKIENHISRKYSNEFRDELDKNDRHEYGSNSSGKNHNVKELEISEESSEHKTKEETQNRHDERRGKKERRDDRHNSKEGGRDRVQKSASRPRDSDSRKRSSSDYIRDGRRERRTGSRGDAKEENDGKRARSKDDKREKHRDRGSNDSSRHDKRHTSSSVSNRDREHRDGARAGDSSDESSDDSEKKLHSRRRISPSPVRSRKRHVSRSPHSKHSQSKHSPYSSLENSRGKKSRSMSRSRSRSPVRRKR